VRIVGGFARDRTADHFSAETGHVFLPAERSARHRFQQRFTAAGAKILLSRYTDSVIEHLKVMASSTTNPRSLK